MCSLVSAEPSDRGCGVRASLPSVETRKDSFSTPLAPPCRICGSPLLMRLAKRRSKSRSIALAPMVSVARRVSQECGVGDRSVGGHPLALPALAGPVARKPHAHCARIPAEALSHVQCDLLLSDRVAEIGVGSVGGGHFIHLRVGSNLTGEQLAGDL